MKRRIFTLLFLKRSVLYEYTQGALNLRLHLSLRCCNIETFGDPLRSPRVTYMDTPKTENHVRCVSTFKSGHEHLRINSCY